MSFFSFKSGQRELPHGWKHLKSAEDLEHINHVSKSKPVVLFKHSTRCGTSFMVKDQLESAWNLSEDDLEFYYLDLLAHRDISNLIASQYGVVHQSPQILVIKDGKSVFDTSHQMISVRAIANAIKP
ncbi:MAG: bacillithiol system redox-active protein YtxJ [Bacteroidetes bacterium]|nr:bacillithiol system redox-active protein YtxJ [Bacteroidota bacterium]